MIPGVEIQGAPYLIDLMADPEMETLSFSSRFCDLASLRRGKNSGGKLRESQCHKISMTLSFCEKNQRFHCFRDTTTVSEFSWRILREI
jgi:hypothetical protein